MSNTRKASPAQEAQKAEAQEAQKAEAKDTRVTVTYKGNEYSVPLTKHWSLDAADMLHDGHLGAALRELLTPEEHKVFRASKPDITEAGELLDLLGEAAGIGDSGE